MYLYLLLITRLMKSQRTLFQTTTGHVYAISHIVEDLGCNGWARFDAGFDDIISLVDGDGPRFYPDERLVQHRVVLTSPQGDFSSRKWMHQLSMEDVATGYVMRPCCSREVILIGLASTLIATNAV